MIIGAGVIGCVCKNVCTKKDAKDNNGKKGLDEIGESDETKGGEEK